MAKKFVITYKSGREIVLEDKFKGGPPMSGTRIRSNYEDFLKTGTQNNRQFDFWDRKDTVANSNIHFTVDFRDLSSILEFDM